jgi:hypothetical protein
MDRVLYAYVLLVVVPQYDLHALNMAFFLAYLLPSFVLASLLYLSRLISLCGAVASLITINSCAHTNNYCICSLSISASPLQGATEDSMVQPTHRQ